MNITWLDKAILFAPYCLLAFLGIYLWYIVTGLQEDVECLRKEISGKTMGELRANHLPTTNQPVRHSRHKEWTSTDEFLERLRGQYNRDRATSSDARPRPRPYPIRLIRSGNGSTAGSGRREPWFGSDGADSAGLSEHAGNHGEADSSEA